MSNEKMKKPIYKRWWFILGVLLILSTAFNSEDEKPDEMNDKDVTTVAQQTENVADGKETETKEIKEEIDLTSTIKEIKDASNGFITDIEQFNGKSLGWSAVKVTVVDDWYQSQDYEKERFAEATSDAINSVLKQVGAVEKDKTVYVYFYDQYDKELAEQKLTGGFKIKR